MLYWIYSISYCPDKISEETLVTFTLSKDKVSPPKHWPLRYPLHREFICITLTLLEKHITAKLWSATHITNIANIRVSFWHSKLGYSDAGRHPKHCPFIYNVPTFPTIFVLVSVSHPSFFFLCFSSSLQGVPERSSIHESCDWSTVRALRNHSLQSTSLLFCLFSAIFIISKPFSTCFWGYK